MKLAPLRIRIAPSVSLSQSTLIRTPLTRAGTIRFVEWRTSRSPSTRRTITIMPDHATLIKPPPLDPSKSRIENVLELTPLTDIGPDIYTNTRPLWHPPGARGIFGGAAIAQCLSAAQSTVPSNFTVHSMHCYFVLAGDADIPIVYHVEHVREGRSFATRTVQARQRGRPIFTTTMSFIRSNSGGSRLIEHQTPMPAGIPTPAADLTLDDRGMSEFERGGGPFVSRRISVLNKDSPDPHVKHTRQWIRVKGTISPQGGHQAHLSALAYMSDSYFIGTVSRVHKLQRFSFKQNIERLRKSGLSDDAIRKHIDEWRDEGAFDTDTDDDDNNDDNKNNMDNNADNSRRRRRRPEIGMMVSLDHTIYFHNPRAFRADEWMFTEMQSPWAGDGRGLVFQKIWSKDGVLVATCVQEGVVRLKQDPPENSTTSAEVKPDKKSKL